MAVVVAVADAVADVLVLVLPREFVVLEVE